jgi:PAS domain S-box-containing protein
MMTIILADDEPSLLELGKVFLERTGDLKVITALGAEEAMEILRSTKVDGIISDYQMPGMDGIAFLQKVRIRYPEMPFMMYTGKGQEDVVISALRNGCDYYLPKGDDPKSEFAELALQVRRMVRNKNLERDLNESEERYRLIIENFTGIILQRRADNRIIYVNGAVESITGYPAEMLMSGDFSWDTIVHPDDLPLLSQTIEDARADPSVVSVSEYRIITKEGDVRWVQESCNYVRKKSGKISSVHGTLYDITDRKQMEEQLISQRDLGLSLAAARSLDEAVSLCLDTASRVAEMGFGALYLEDVHAESYTLSCATGFSDSFLASVQEIGKDAPLARRVAEGEYIYARYSDLPEMLGYTPGKERIQVILIVPIIYNNASIGFILLGSNYSEIIPDSSLMSLEVIAYQVGNAIARIWVEEMLARAEVGSGFFKSAPAE